MRLSRAQNVVMLTSASREGKAMFGRLRKVFKGKRVRVRVLYGSSDRVDRRTYTVKDLVYEGANYEFQQDTNANPTTVCVCIKVTALLLTTKFRYRSISRVLTT